MKCKEVKTFTRDNNFQKSVGKVEFLSDLNDEQLEDLKQPFWTKFFNQFK